MANIHDCLQRAIDSGDIARSQGEAAQTEYQQLVARFSSSLPPAQAQAEAARVLREVTEANARRKRHTVIHQLQTMVRLKDQIEGATDPAKALKLLLEFDGGARAAGFTGESVRSLQDALVKSAMWGIRDTLRAVGPKLSGAIRDPAMLREIIRELHGEATGNVPARELADAIRAQQERLRQMFNAHGGDIGKLDDFGVTHAHDARAIRRAGFDAWRDAVFDNLEWSRIIDLQTGKAFTTAPGGRPNRAAAEAFLKRVYDQIVTQGWATRDPGMTTGGRALYNQRAEHRVLHFKSGDAWMEYNKAYGLADPFSAITAGLKSMARDVALMRVLGPNPKAGLEFASQVAMKRAQMGDGSAVGRVGKAADTARLMLFHLDGSANVPSVGNEAFANFMSGTRGVLTGTQLGSALLSSTTDLATVSAGAMVAGLNPGNIVARATSLIGSGDARVAAGNAGYILDSLAEANAAGARMGLDEMMPEIARRVSNVTMRASGLQLWTDAWRVAIQLEFAAELGANAGRTFDQLDPRLQAVLSQRQITAADWDQLRQPSVLFSPKPGTAFVQPEHFLMKSTLPRTEAEGLAMRLQMAIEEQLEVMMPTFNLQARAKVIGEARPGTIRGELARSILQYKSYPIAFTISQIQRVRFGRVGSRLGYAAGMVAAMTVLGSLAIQMKEIAKGRDPRPMTDLKFWLAAGIQGGGAGIFGDFFFSESSRAGGGIAETIMGPAAGLAGDVIGLAAENIGSAAAGRDMRLGRDVANFVRYNTPVASSLWYARAAFDRLVADNLQRILDPEAEAAFRDRARRQEREYGNQSFWMPGENLPRRSPDVTSATRTQ